MAKHIASAKQWLRISHEGIRCANTCSSTYRIQTWALEEARRRLEAEGILPDPSTPAAGK